MLEGRLCELLAGPQYRPLKQHELAAALHLHRDEKQLLRWALRDLERQGRIVCLRKNRWALPSPVRQNRVLLRGLPTGGALAFPLEPPGEDYFIDRDSLAGAIDGDQALVEPLRKRMRREGEPGRTPARIIRVMPREGRPVAGTLMKGRGYWYIIPDQARIQSNVQVTGFSSAFGEPALHHKVVVHLDDWKGPASSLTGIAVEDLGPVDAAGVRLLSLMRNHGLDTRFESGVDHEARQRSPSLADHDLHGREDLRGWVTFTIDPEDARDFDDAISLRRLDDDSWEAGIHIADVAHFVSPGSEVDREARRRGNSVYLVGGFVPMLPPYLTSDICSLRPDVDRLTHTALLVLDTTGRVKSARTFRSVIHSAARLTYEQAQQFMDQGEAPGVPPAVQDVLRDMIPLARTVRRRRMQAGSIDLTMPEVKCDLDEMGRAVAFHRRGAPEAYHLIEEFMLLANVAVAESISTKKIPALYRIHEEPSEEQWAGMAHELGLLGLSRQPTDPASINEVCREVAGTPMEYPANLAILRSMKRALYADALIGHFGLGFPKYTHFTSPIRRYPDLVVHRILCALETGQPPPYSHPDMRAIAQHCSATERTADDAESESLQEQRIAYFAARVAAGELGPHKALITGVLSRGLLVELEESLQRGLIPLQSLPRDGYIVDQEQGQIRGQHTRATFRIGTRVEVELLRVDETRRLVDFRLLSVGTAPSFPKAKPAPGHAWPKGGKKKPGKRPGQKPGQHRRRQRMR